MVFERRDVTMVAEMASSHPSQAQPSFYLVSQASRTEDEHKIHEYEKIVQFHDAILAGKHPTIHAPAATAASEHSHAVLNNSHTQLQESDATSKGAELYKRSSEGGMSPAREKPSKAVKTHTFAPLSADSGTVEIDSILLEKSDELFRAEIQIQRQRLEQALKDEVEQRRVRKHQQTAVLADFDLSDVLAKALTLVQASSAPNECLTANVEAASDSFDENTFYSSRHDTPESNQLSRVPNGTEEAPLSASQGELPRFPEAETSSRNFSAVESGAKQPASQPFSHPHLYASSTKPSQATLVPGLNNYIHGGTLSNRPSQNASGELSLAEGLGNTEAERSGPSSTRDPAYFQDDIYADSRPPSPLMRPSGIGPGPLQPAQMPSAASSGHSKDTTPGGVNVPTAAPAQVAALRNEPAVLTSPESSPQGGRPFARKKEKAKKKKRKAGRQAPETDDARSVKLEPRSPSPQTAPSYIRPSKRQRRVQGNNETPAYGVPIFEPHAIDVGQAEVQPSYREMPNRYMHESDHSYRPLAGIVSVEEARLGREYVDDRRYVNVAYSGHNPTSAQRPNQHIPGGRTASHVLVSNAYMGPTRPHQQYGMSQIALRPEDEFAAGPPNSQMPRIVVDATGREYIEPMNPSSRQPMAPYPQPGNADLPYHRPLARAVSMHPGIDSYEERSSMVYARPPSPYSMPQRILTQPEYETRGVRDGDVRGFSARPLLPQADYTRAMAPSEWRQAEAGPWEYISRAASVRPADAGKYDLSQEYGRVQSVRPETAGRAYVGRVHPQASLDVGRPLATEYNARHVDQQAVRRGYGVRRPVERFYEPAVRADDEIAFIERPRGQTHEIVYTDDARTEVYR